MQAARNREPTGVRPGIADNTLLLTAALAALSFGAQEFGNRLLFAGTDVSAFSPVAGIALASFVLFGWKAMPGVLLGTFFGRLTIQVPITSLAAAALQSASYFLTATVFTRVRGPRTELSPARDTGKVLLYAGLPGALLYVVTSAAIHATGWPGVRATLPGDIAGIVLTLPAFLCWVVTDSRTAGSSEQAKAGLPRYAEPALFLLLLTAACGALWLRDAVVSRRELAYAVFLLLIWAALRLGHRLATTALLFTGLAVAFAEGGHGLPNSTGDENFTRTYLFVFSLAIATVAISVETEEGRYARASAARAGEQRDKTENDLRRSENLFRATFDQAAIGMCHVAPDGTFVSVNDALCRMLGYSRSELLKCRFGDLTHPDDLETDWSQANALLRGEIAVYSMEKRYFHQSGEIVWGQLTVSLVRTPGGAADYFISVIEDITARRHTLDRLREAEERFRWLIDRSPIGVVEARQDGHVERANEAFYRIVGWEREAFSRQAMDLRKITPPEWREATAAVVDGCFDNLTSATFEKEYQRPDGTRVPVLMAMSVPPERRDEILIFVLDLTEQKRTGAQLRRSEERLHAAQRAVQAGTFDRDLRTGEWEWSPETYSQYGMPPGTAITADLWSSMIVPADRERVMAAVAESIETGVLYNTEFRVQRPDGVVWISGTGSCIFDALGPARFAGISVDVTRRKVAEIALETSERQFRQVAETMPQIIWTCHANGTPDYFNHEWYDVTGPHAANGDWGGVLHPDDLQPCLTAWSHSVAVGSDYQLQFRLLDCRKNAYRWYLARALPLRDENGTIVRWVGTCTDIDEQKRFSEQLELSVAYRTSELRQSLDEKTTLLKELHHRVKNNLQVVCSLLSMQIDGTATPQVSDSLLRALHRVQSMALVHEQLYQSETLSRINFAGYIDVLASSLFQAYCLDPARIKLELAVEAIEVSIDHAIPCGLVLNELVSNSLKHAFPDTRKGTIRISLSRVGKRRIELLVADDGVGMPDTWQTTGFLGMRVVKALAGQLGAELTIGSERGSRTTVCWDIGGGER